MSYHAKPPVMENSATGRGGTNKFQALAIQQTLIQPLNTTTYEWPGG